MRGYLIVREESHAVSLIRDGDGHAVPGIGSITATAGGWSIDGRQVPGVVAVHGRDIWVHVDGAAHHLVWQHPVDHHAGEVAGSAGDTIRAPMPGAVVSIAVAAGESVAAGDPLLVIESMKLETTIRAPRDGVMEEIAVTVGQTFERDALLASLRTEESE